MFTKAYHIMVNAKPIRMFFHYPKCLARKNVCPIDII